VKPTEPAVRTRSPDSGRADTYLPGSTTFQAIRPPDRPFSLRCNIDGKSGLPSIKRIPDGTRMMPECTPGSPRPGLPGLWCPSVPMHRNGYHRLAPGGLLAVAIVGAQRFLLVRFANSSAN